MCHISILQLNFSWIKRWKLRPAWTTWTFRQKFFLKFYIFFTKMWINLMELIFLTKMLQIFICSFSKWESFGWRYDGLLSKISFEVLKIHVHWNVNLKKGASNKRLTQGLRNFKPSPSSLVCVCFYLEFLFKQNLWFGKYLPY